MAPLPAKVCGGAAEQCDQVGFGCLSIKEFYARGPSRSFAASVNRAVGVKRWQLKNAGK